MIKCKVSFFFFSQKTYFQVPHPLLTANVCLQTIKYRYTGCPKILAQVPKLLSIYLEILHKVYREMHCFTSLAALR